MKTKILKVLAGIALASILAACGDSDSGSTNPEQVSVRDSVVFHDSLNWIDSVRFIDSLRIKDSLLIKDSLRIKDSVRVKDSIRFVDSLRIKYKDSLNIIDSLFIRYKDSIRVLDSINIVDSLNITFKDSTRIIDSLNIIDSLHITFMDSTRIVDSIVTYGAEVFLGPCNASNAGSMKRTTVNGESRYYYCDMGTYLWRIATDAEVKSIVNTAYVRESHVTEFVPLDSVVEKMNSDDKLIVVLRHAEREDDITMASPLTANGIEQSKQVGKGLVNSPDPYFAGSQYVRTHQTYNNIAIGRNDTLGRSSGADTLGDTMFVLNEGWFTKNFDLYFMATFRENDDGRGVITKWAAEGGYTDVFYDLAPRSSELLEDYLFPALDMSGKRFGVFISHDVMIIPLVSYVSEQRITFNYYKAVQGDSEGDNWLNYLAGIAVIVRPDGSREFYAVRGLESGKMHIDKE